MASVTGEYQTFQDIYEAVIEDSKLGTLTNTDVVARVKRYVNQGYQDIITRRSRDFLDQDFEVITDAQIQGDCSVTNGSTTVTFSALTASISSLTTTDGEYQFFIGGFDPVYQIASIGSSTITLNSPYIGTTDTSVTGTIVQSAIPLSNTIKTVITLDHDLYPDLRRAVGIQSLLKLRSHDNQGTGAPRQWATDKRVASTNGLKLYLYPYPDQEYLLKLHCSTYFEQLVNDDDEPLIPVEYRQILYWYALWQCFKYQRNAQWAQDTKNEYLVWLNRLDTEMKPSQDDASLVYDANMQRLTPWKLYRNSNFATPDDD